MTSTAPEVITPRPRTVARRLAFWFGAGALAVVIGIISFATAGNSVGGTYLDPTNAAPPGTLALAEVLRQQGVTVDVTSSLDETRDVISSPGSTTLLIHDLDKLLDDEQLREAVTLADTVIVVDASFGELRAIAPELAQAGSVTEPRTADCDLPLVQRAGTVSGSGNGYRVIDESAEVTACLGSGDGVYSLIELPAGDGNGTLTILGATDALTNQFIIDDGNAAFALGLLGATESLVWYEPSFADLASDGPVTIGDLTPLWVTPVLGLLIMTVIAAAIWRGRRFGPLVIENLPVTVRASETMQGRARLYERSGSRQRALDALRIGTVQRLGALCGLPRVASVDDVVAAVAAVTGSGSRSGSGPGPGPGVSDIRHLLIDAVPSTDGDLVALSDQLLTLERAVTTALRT